MSAGRVDCATLLLLPSSSPSLSSRLNLPLPFPPPAAARPSLIRLMGGRSPRRIDIIRSSLLRIRPARVPLLTHSRRSVSSLPPSAPLSALIFLSPLRDARPVSPSVRARLASSVFLPLHDECVIDRCERPSGTRHLPFLLVHSDRLSLISSCRLLYLQVERVGWRVFLLLILLRDCRCGCKFLWCPSVESTASCISLVRS